MTSGSPQSLRSNPDTRRMFDATAVEYDPNEWFDRTRRSAYAFAVTRKRLLQLLALQGDETVLEVGCGPGTWTREIAPLVRSVHAVDISAEMVRRAEHFAPATSTTFQVQDFASFHTDEKFDRVVSVRAVEYMRDGIEAVNKLGSFVTPGGRLVVVTKTPFSIWRGRRFLESRLQRGRRSGSPDADSHQGPDFFHRRLSAKKLTSALEGAGFEDVNVHPVVTGLPFVAGVRGDIPIIPSGLAPRALGFMNRCSDWLDEAPPAIVLNSLWLTESFALCARLPVNPA